MDDPIFTEEMAARVIIQQMDDGDFSAAQKILDLANQGDKSAIKIRNIIDWS